MGGTDGAKGNSITTDASGNIYSTGIFRGAVDFDPGAGVFNLTSAAGNIYSYDGDIFIQKVDSNGNFIWAKSMGDTIYDHGISITTDVSGNVYSTGVFQGTVDFDPGAGSYILNSNGSSDIFIQKLDSNGNFIWAKSMGSTEYDAGFSVTTDASGNVYTTGRFQNIVDFDPGPGTFNLTSNGDHDIFIQKLDPNGNLLWARSMGGTGSERGNSITTDALGNVYTTGWFQNTVDFDPGSGVFNLTSNGSYDIFIQKLDANGNFIWAINMGGTSADLGNSITTDASGNVYTTGEFQDTVDFDPGAGTFNLTTNWGNDIFIQKLSQCAPSTGTNVISTCDSYLWIDGNTYTSSNTTATHTLFNVAGCDSIVTLNLTINNVNVGVIQNQNILTSSQIGGTYQWVQCPSMSFLPGDTSQVFTATFNSDYAVITTYNGCVDTSACYTVNTVEIIENDFGNELLFYPNPSDGDFTIDLGNNYETITIKLTDLNGKLIETNSYKNTQLMHLKIEEPVGIYLLNIETEAEKAIIKLMKE